VPSAFSCSMQKAAAATETFADVTKALH